MVLRLVIRHNGVPLAGVGVERGEGLPEDPEDGVGWLTVRRCALLGRLPRSPGIPLGCPRRDILLGQASRPATARWP